MVWIKIVEIKKAVNRLLKGRYPTYKIYGKEIAEGYDEPCFFTEIIDGGSRAETTNFAKGRFTVKITYFQSKKNELDQLEKADEIKDLFGLFFCVENRKLTVKEFSHDYIGEYQDILQISVDFEYAENTHKEDMTPAASEISVNIVQE